jgi:hypothetical protein
MAERWRSAFDAAMSQPSTCSPLYWGLSLSPEIITWCGWLYYRFSLSLRDGPT